MYDNVGVRKSGIRTITPLSWDQEDQKKKKRPSAKLRVQDFLKTT